MSISSAQVLLFTDGATCLTTLAALLEVQNVVLIPGRQVWRSNFSACGASHCALVRQKKDTVDVKRSGRYRNKLQLRGRANA